LNIHWLHRVLQQDIEMDNEADANLRMDILAKIYIRQGCWEKDEELQVQVKKALGNEHPDTLISMANLATTYGKWGQWKKAKQLKEQIVMIQKRILGSEHPDTLISIDDLAFTYQNQTLTEEKVENVQGLAIKMKERFPGNDHFDPSTPLTMMSVMTQMSVG
jgi:hypothetical protein